MIELLYIASPSFSGSTLLTFLLNAHPKIATIGELKWGDIDLASYRCSCGALLAECDFWREVEARMLARGLPFDLHRPATDFRCRTRPLADRALRARIRGQIFESARSLTTAVLPSVRRTWPLVARVNRAMIEIILDLQGGKVFVDASKDPVRLMHLARTGDYDVRVLQLVRDGRAVACSAMKNEGQTVEAAAREWLHTHQQIERLRAKLGGDRLLTVRYEDLCADPQATILRAYDFLGVPALVPVNSRSRAEQHIIGNRMRLRPMLEVRADEKWRLMLSRQDIAEFDRIAGRQNQSYAYV